MATYTITGHPLNYSDLGVSNPELIRAAIMSVGVGQTVNLTLAGPDDTKVKGHGILK